jgi:hypothetical protein
MLRQRGWECQVLDGCQARRIEREQAVRRAAPPTTPRRGGPTLTLRRIGKDFAGPERVDIWREPKRPSRRFASSMRRTLASIVCSLTHGTPQQGGRRPDRVFPSQGRYGQYRTGTGIGQIGREPPFCCTSERSAASRRPSRRRSPKARSDAQRSSTQSTASFSSPHWAAMSTDRRLPVRLPAGRKLPNVSAVGSRSSELCKC